MLAGPQLIGVQPNQGELIVDGTVRSTAPAVLTFRFDEGQTIDPATFGGIEIVGAGPDGTFDPTGRAGTDDVAIEPALVTAGQNAPNEVVVRFAEALPDDSYQIRINSVDDPSAGVVALRNIDGDALMPSDSTTRREVINFDLNLGAIVESVVPQPVIRNADGSLSQNRNEIVVYFNEDPLFVEDAPVSATVNGGGGVDRTIEFLTIPVADDLTVVFNRDNATTGDLSEVAVTFDDATSTLTVATRSQTRLTDVLSAINELESFRVRTAAGATAFFRPADGTSLTLSATPTERSAENPRFYQLFHTQETVRTTDDALYFPEEVIYDPATFTARLFFADDLANLPDDGQFAGPGLDGGTFRLRIGTAVDQRSDIILPPVDLGVLPDAGDTFDTASDFAATFFNAGNRTSLTLSGEIAPTSNLDIPVFAGLNLVSDFGGFPVDTTSGVPTIPYNFQSIYEQIGSLSQLNQITTTQQARVREVLDLYARELGVQFVETVDEGITFAVGGLNTLLGDVDLQPELNAAVRVDPNLSADPAASNAAIVFGNDTPFNTEFGADFTRKTAAGVGLLLGLQTVENVPPQTVLALNPDFLESDVDQLSNLEATVPGPLDVLQGRTLYRTDSNDVDLYRFDVDLGDEDQVGTFTAETFAERLPDSSPLDTTLTLFGEQSAFAVTDFGLGLPLQVRFESAFDGRIGNDTEVRFVRSGRNNDNSVRVTFGQDSQRNQIDNVLVVDLPRVSGGTTGATIGDVLSAINLFGGGVLSAELVDGDATQIAGETFNLNPVVLGQGGLVPLTRNDDYFSEDSRLIASLGSGRYYIGVAASGNEVYDPTISNSGDGGRTQGRYDLQLIFEPQVDETDALRDSDGTRANVPGTPIDGDGDGVPGGEYNFWFQTRSLDRRLSLTSDGTAIVPGSTIEITDILGESRTYEFVTTDGDQLPGNVPVNYSGQGTTALSPSVIASLLAEAFDDQTRETRAGNVSVAIDNQTLTFQGVRSIELSRDFVGADVHGRTIFVDKSAPVSADGSLDRPFNNISNPNVPNAFESAIEGDIVRIVGNGGIDGDITTESDNAPYLIGLAATGGGVLQDGVQMEIPRGVTTMIDSGSIFKLRNARIGAGSSTLINNRSGAALQVLGTPRRVTLTTSGTFDPNSPDGLALQRVAPEPEIDNEVVDGYRDGAVIFTSLNDDGVGGTQNASTAAAPGDWGGLVFRRDVDQLEGRRDLEDEGIFLQNVTHADIRYGGSSNVVIDSVQQLVNPITVFNLRPTITQNVIRFSADSAISASPDSFEETSFQAPRFQTNGEFTADYTRIGPAIYDNLIVDNSINALFVRISTTPGQPPAELTTAGRFDDIDIVHFFSENLIIAGTPGGSIEDRQQPDLVSAVPTSFSGGQLQTGSVRYRATFVDRDGFESLASEPTTPVDVEAGDEGQSIRIDSLPPVPASSEFIGRRIYRSIDGGPFQFAGQINATEPQFIDDGSVAEGVLDLARQGVRGRLDASLVADPALVMKFRGARLEFGQGTQYLAEGLSTDPVVMTSFADDRFGAGGTFDTNNDDTFDPERQPQRGDWAGIYASAASFISLDNAVVAYGGGNSLLAGGVARGFAALELQQADGRITNSRFEFNADAQSGAGPLGRDGRLSVTPATIYVRGSQPVIVGNDFVDNRGSVIDIDVDSMTAERLVDFGRGTGSIDTFDRLANNYGPLIRLNRFENVPTSDIAQRQLSGLEIRGGLISTETIFDDTDIDHLLFETLEVGNNLGSGGLRLLSRSDQSLVVKLAGPGSPYDANFGTGITAGGTLSTDSNRIGGTVQIVGLPGSPVVLTSLSDDTVGSGVTPTGSPLTDTGGDGFTFRPRPNDWRSVLLDRYSNDNNFDYILEETITAEPAPGLNGTTRNAQVLGVLAPNEFATDEVRRLGFEVEGFLSANNDVDTYSFTANAGTRIFIDVDNTSVNLDTVIELLDDRGNVLARSDNSFAESDRFITTGDAGLEAVDPIVAENVGPLTDGPAALRQLDAAGLIIDRGTNNVRDAGLSVTLPGNRGSEGLFYFRVRSDSGSAGDTDGGLTDGGYRVQVRLTPEQQVAGSVVRFADIRYANHGVHIIGKPGQSPLLGDAQEIEGTGDFPIFLTEGVVTNNEIQGSPFTPGSRAQFLGNLSTAGGGVLSVGGELSTVFTDVVVTGSDAFGDIDFYQIDVAGGDLLQSTVFDIDYADGFSRPDTSLAVFYDDPSTGFDPTLVAYGTDSNVFDDVALATDTDPIELLRRGSIATGDPMIGPLNLVQGTYYVAVVPDGLFPTAIVEGFTRREPIESIQRIFDDVVDDAVGAAGTVDSGQRITTQSAAELRFLQTVDVDVDADPDTPDERQLVDDATLGNDGFTISGRDSALAGHTPATTFNFARQTDRSVINTSEFTDPAGLIPPANAVADAVPLLDPIGFGQNVLQFGLLFDANIGDQDENTSTEIPHVTINGAFTARNEPAYAFTFEVPDDGTGADQRVILDIDNGDRTLFDNSELTFPGGFPVFDDPLGIDLSLQLFDATGASIFTSTGSSVDDGAEGSEPSIAGGSTGGLSADPYIEQTLAPGTYTVAVLAPETTVDTDEGTFDRPLEDDETPDLGTFTLNVSIENQSTTTSFAGDDGGNLSVVYDRNDADGGSLRSREFSLQGYAAADLPRFYFDYRYDPAENDSVIVEAILSGDDTNPIRLGQIQPDGFVASGLTLQPITPLQDRFQQAIVDLSPLMDLDDLDQVQLQIRYLTDGTANAEGADGLSLDNFIVGFAERGELVSGAGANQTGFEGSTNTTEGLYQLEIRPGTDYVVPNPTVVVDDDSPSSLLAQYETTRSFDTNLRHTVSATIIAPSADQLVDSPAGGDSFTLSDQVRSVTFEFEQTTRDAGGNLVPGGGNGITPGRIAVPYDAGDSASQVAASIRNVLNSGLVTSTLDILAADSSGQTDINLFNDGRAVAIDGVIVGDFIQLTGRDQLGSTRDDVTVGGEFRLPVVYSGGTGDSNVVRSQSQILIDSNRISDVRGIGIWSEFGQRDRDPNTSVANVFPFQIDQEQVDDVFIPLLVNPISFGFGEDTIDPLELRGINPYLQQTPTSNISVGAVRNLPTLNDSVLGGITPGPVLVNNTIDDAGYTGIKVDGAARPFTIDSTLPSNIATLDGDLYSSATSFGLTIVDGLTFTIDAAGNRVVFEFEELTGSADTGGSEQSGGDGYADGNVPVYYRHDNLYDGRAYASTRHEVMLSIYQSIQGSTLVQNGLVQLVEPSVGPSQLFGNPGSLSTYISDLNFPTPAVFLEGVEGIYFGATDDLNIFGFNNPFVTELAPAYEAPQPSARIVNNTIIGSDGRGGQDIQNPPNDPGDLLAAAVATDLSLNKQGVYSATQTIGDNSAGNRDVDFYRVQLQPGDRLVADVDTPVISDGTNAFPSADLGLRLFDANGRELIVNDNATLRANLDITGDDVAAIDANNDGVITGNETVNVDPSFDFVATEAGTYFVAVSDSVNLTFDPSDADGRASGDGGDYTLNLRLFAPRSTVFSFGDGDQDNGVDIQNLVGTTFTVTQLADLANQPTNQVVFEFVAGNVPLTEGAVPVRIGAPPEFDNRIPDLMVEIANSINGFNSPLRNYEDGNGPGGFSGPVQRPIALAIGGQDGVTDFTGREDLIVDWFFDVNNLFDPTIAERSNVVFVNSQDRLNNFVGGETGEQFFNGLDNGPQDGTTDNFVEEFINSIEDTEIQTVFTFPLPGVLDPFGLENTDPILFDPFVLTAANATRTDFYNGFGADPITGVTTDLNPDGTTELYVLLENIDSVTLSPEAIAAGLGLDPRPGFNTDQILPQTGVLLTGGSSATVANTVFSNLTESLVVAETNEVGFGSEDDIRLDNLFYKPSEVIVTANVFQNDEPDENAIVARNRVGAISDERGNTISQGLTTDALVGPSSVNGGDDDFNFIADGDQTLFINPGGGNFLPSDTSPLIDASVADLTERGPVRNLRASIGLPVSNISAPQRDINGVLAADDPTIAPPVGLGDSIFRDRGSNERADFIGPVATLFTPADNDADGVDLDPAVSFVTLSSGVFEEFQIQLRDTGDQSDPFRGVGLDDDTVVVASIDDLRRPGANFTLFENDRLLTEGVDYTFQFDSTQNIVTLRSLAGIFRDDRAYRIAVNNQDSTVLVAPSASGLADGDQLRITNAAGADLVFEVETGVSVALPDPLTLIVPETPLGVTGLVDGDEFVVRTPSEAVTFEFDNNNSVLSGNVAVPLPTGPAPVDPVDLLAFRQQLAVDIAAAINAPVAIQLDPNTGASMLAPVDLDVDATAVGDRVIIGGDLGSSLSTVASGLSQNARNQAIVVPGVGLSNADGDTITIDDGNTTVVFELDTDGRVAESAVAVPVGEDSLDNAAAILDAITRSALAIQPRLIGETTIALNLPPEGTVSVSPGDIEIRGIAQPIEDGATLTITEPVGSGAMAGSTVFEFDVDGVVDDSDAIAIPVNRSSTAAEVATAILNQLAAADIDGVRDGEPVVLPQNGLLVIGGAEGLNVVSDSPAVVVLGSAGVADSSTLTIAGPVEIVVPFSGGDNVEDGDVIVIDTLDGQPVVFEFVLDGRAVSIAGAFPVPYQNDSQSVTLTNNLIAAVNASPLEITAAAINNRIVSLGLISIDRVDLNADGLAPGRAADAFEVEQGLIEDGETFSITQGDTTVTFEFLESGSGSAVTGTNVPITFDPVGTGDTDADRRALNELIIDVLNANRGGLQIDPMLTPDGLSVELNDIAGSVVDVSGSQSLQLTGVAGRATAVRLSPTSDAAEVKRQLIAAINSLDFGSTGVAAADRGGNTLSVTGGVSFDGITRRFSLPAIADQLGNPLEPNRPDGTTQFNILFPSIGLDFGDAPDPLLDVPGQYPTLLINDGPRHIVSNPGDVGALLLGNTIDVETNGLPSAGADGDDLSISATASDNGDLFTLATVDGNVSVTIDDVLDDVLSADGQTITITSGATSATFEFDVDGRFDEDNFAIAPENPSAIGSIREALEFAIGQSPLNVASFTAAEGTLDTFIISADDEDGVSLAGDLNPAGVLNNGVALSFDVTVTGSGVVEAWIDFDGNGIFDTATEQVLPLRQDAAYLDRFNELCGDGNPDASNSFSPADGMTTSTRSFCIVVPPTANLPTDADSTFARFRVSRAGGLTPTGLALSGEVEDYELEIVQGTPPAVSDANALVTYTTLEDTPFRGNDVSGQSPLATDGILAGFGGDALVFSGDVQTDQPIDINGNPVAADSSEAVGTLTVRQNGGITFEPTSDFFTTPNNPVRFDVRVISSGAADSRLIAPRPVTVEINITPVNDPTTIIDTNGATRTIFAPEGGNENGEIIIEATELFRDGMGDNPVFSVGPANESDQQLRFATAGQSPGGTNGRTPLGGRVRVSADGRSLIYTPDPDLNNVTDEIRYVVRDSDPTEPGATLATGTVNVTLQPVNDGPIANRTPYTVLENNMLTIPINPGTASPVRALLEGAVPGPADEQLTLDNGTRQSVEFLPAGFPQTTAAGTLSLTGAGATQSLVFVPAAGFNGVATFNYTLRDIFVDSGGNRIANPPGFTPVQTNATLTINVGDNDPPIFTNRDGTGRPLPIVVDEAQTDGVVRVVQLGQFFTDPNNQPITFSVTGGGQLLTPTIDANTGRLSLALSRNRSGETSIEVVATDNPGGGQTGLSTTVTIPVTVTNINNAPQIGTPLDPQNVAEDAEVLIDLNAAFVDADNEPLTFVITSLGGQTTVGGIRQAINDSPLIDSIPFLNLNNEVAALLSINLVDNAFGTETITITATDSSGASIAQTFNLNVESREDPAVAVDDEYDVLVGNELRSVNSAGNRVVPSLLANDFDPDTGDNSGLAIDPASIRSVGVRRGDLTVTADGEFRYFNRNGRSGNVDVFEYRLAGSTEVGRVRFVLREAGYQNPRAGLREDVSGDGFVTPIDALRVINFLRSTQSSPDAGRIPTSSLDFNPPNFLDVNGDDFITPLDALLVINRLRRESSGASVGSGEQIVTAAVTGSSSVMATTATGTDSAASRLSSTTTYAAASPAGLASANLALPIDRPAAEADDDRSETTGVLKTSDVVDGLFAGGVQVESGVAVGPSDIASIDAARSETTSSDDGLRDVTADMVFETF